MTRRTLLDSSNCRFVVLIQESSGCELLLIAFCGDLLLQGAAAGFVTLRACINA